MVAVARSQSTNQRVSSMNVRSVIAPVLIALSLVLIACSGTPKAPPSVWDNLGGEANVRKVVDDFVARAAGNPKVNFFRKSVAGTTEWKPSDAQVALLKQRLVELISSGTGGPMKYAGRPMKATHAGMKISHAEFDALAADLDAALRAGGAKDADRLAVMSFAGSTRADIVERQ
jgi:hemoglobin